MLIILSNIVYFNMNSSLPNLLGQQSNDYNWPQISSYEQISILHRDTDSIYFLDINETLISYGDKWRVFRRNNREHARKLINLINSRSDIDSATKRRMIDWLYDNATTEILDKYIPEFIRKLTSQNIPVLALTAIRPGFASVNSTESVQDIWYKKLTNVSVNFDNKYDRVFDGINELNPDLSDLIIGKLPTKFHELHDACIDKGIVYCCNINKGLIMSKVLESIDQDIKNVVMVDDDTVNLDAIKDWLGKKHPDVNFIGYHIITDLQKDEALGPITDEYIENLIDEAYTNCC